MGGIRWLCVVLGMVFALTSVARAEFPYRAQGAPDDYEQYRLPAGDPVPDDLAGKLTWMYASTAEDNSPLALDERELNGVRGAHLVDADRAADQGWTTTTGRPDVTIGVTDSGIEWDNFGAMSSRSAARRASAAARRRPRRSTARAATRARRGLRRFTRRAASTSTATASSTSSTTLRHRASTRGRPRASARRRVLDPQDVLIAFTDGTDDDANGYVDDMVGWDFLDDDNDPFDDVQYGHGTGEAQDSTAEADNGGDARHLPELHGHPPARGDVVRRRRQPLRRGRRLRHRQRRPRRPGRARDAEQVRRSRCDAIKYAYDHGTTVIASAADEAAQHHNWPSSLPYSIVVNSVTHTDEADQSPGARSYLQFNGCTNFCVADHARDPVRVVLVGRDRPRRGHGRARLRGRDQRRRAGRIRRTRLPARRRRPVPDHAQRGPPGDGVGLVDGAAPTTSTSRRPRSARAPSWPARRCRCPACTDPFVAAADPGRRPPGLSYPARKGHDQFYGYGRVNMAALRSTAGQGRRACRRRSRSRRRTGTTWSTRARRP